MAIMIQVCGSEVQVYDSTSPDADSVLVKVKEPFQGLAQFSLKDFGKGN